MNLKRKADISGAIIAGLILLTFVIAGFGVNRIRFGGTLHSANQQISDFNSDILPPPVYVIEPYLEATMLAHNIGDRIEHVTRLAKLEKDYDDRIAYWKASSIDPALREELLAQAEPSARAFWDELDHTMLPAAGRGDNAAMAASHDRLTQIYQRHRGAIDALVAHTARAQGDVAASSRTTLILVAGFLLVMALAIPALVIANNKFMSHSALTPLAQTAETMTRMAAGDYDANEVREHRQDEIGELTRAIEFFREAARGRRRDREAQARVVDILSKALAQLAEGNLTHRIAEDIPDEYALLRVRFNSALEQMGETLAAVRDSAAAVLNGANEIRAASDDLARRNEEQAASLEQTTGGMAGISTGVRETAGNAGEVRRAIGEAQDEAHAGSAVVSRAVEAMGGIERSAREITQIIDVIDGIAFQTNLLALNAGVEAARAGEAGKGFAVVANEVRALAQRSADAARDIKALINTSTREVDSGVALVGETGTLLAGIGTRITSINGLISDISDAADNQAQGITVISSSMVEMDKMTQKNAAMVEQATAAARSLAEAARELNGLIVRFRTADGEAAARSARLDDYARAA